MNKLRKMDEMEMSVNLNAIRFSWGYSMLFLFVWVLYDWIRNGITGTAFILMTSQFIVYWSIQLFLKWKLGKDEK